MPLIGNATFPGIQSVLSCSYTLSHGITPGTALLTIAPQRDFPTLEGTLTFTFAGLEIPFPNMKVDKTTFKYDQNGLVWQISLLDRRWKWRFDKFSGRWNVREPDHAGEILSDSELNPRLIATLLMGAIGEINFDVSGLPDGARPEIDYQVENPAKALADLAEQFGCRVVLGLDNVVRVVPTGVGLTLPPDGIMAGGATIDPPERPDSLQVVCGPTLYEVNVMLEAVGINRSGEIVPIDELVYKPEGGWGKTDPTGRAAFLNVGDPTKVNDRDRELAKKSVYRIYRVTNRGAFRNRFGDFDLWIDMPLENGADGFRVRTYRQILPLDDKQCDTTHWADPDGILRTVRKPAMVWGTFYFGGPPGTAKLNTDLPEPGKPVPDPGGERDLKNDYRKGFSIDGERGIVTFNDPVFYYDEDGEKFEPAKLALRTAAVVRRPPGAGEGEMAPYRYTFTFNYPEPHLITGPRILKHDELVLRVHPEYSPGNGEPLDDSFDNIEDLRPEADYYLEAAKADYQQTYPEERVYMGLVPISPDGAIQQVTWNVGPNGATTQASRNTEHALWVPPYKERRFLELLHGGRFFDIEVAAKRIRRQEYFKRLDNA